MNIIDMHCHILPGLDDGAQSLEEAVRALQEAKKQGIDQVILTPHHYPDSDMPIELIFQTMKQLEDAIQENEIGIKLYGSPGKAGQARSVDIGWKQICFGGISGKCTLQRDTLWHEAVKRSRIHTDSGPL